MIAHRFAPVLRELQPLSDRFAAAGHRLYLVGGTVRDIMLAELSDDRADIDPHFDLDATTTARPEEIKRCLQGWADAIWTLGERFGTIGAMKRVPDGGATAVIERIYEITTHRADAYHDHSRKPDVEFSTDISEDLSRRDFTVNSMAIELGPQSTADELVLVDPFGGMNDLRDRVLRTPQSAEISFSDDPLRMLRAARFIARYGLQPDEPMLRAVRALGDRMQIVSSERVRDELYKLLAAPLPGEGLRFVADTGLLQYVVPELVAAVSQPDEPCHADLWAHTIDLVDAIESPAQSDEPPAFDRRIVRLAALLHPLGARRAQARLQALRATNDDTRDVVRLIEQLAVLLERFVTDDASWSDGDVRRHVGRAGPQLAGLHALVLAEVQVHRPVVADRLAAQLLTLQSRIADLAASEPLDDLSPQLDGETVMRVLGVPPGRAVGQAIAFLTELRLDEGLLAESDLHDRLEEWWSNHDLR